LACGDELVVIPVAGSKEKLMRVADVVDPLVRAGLGSDLPVRLRRWDGSELGPPSAPVQLTFTSPRALRRLLWAPNELGFARAYVSGDVLIEGDIMAGLSALDRVADPEFGPGVCATNAGAWAL
jgi:cyclopropane-fatty-acyl-phospholipid synthase